MRTHRRVRPHQRQTGQLPPRFVVQERTHAVQPLELVALAGAERMDGGERVGVVGGELRKEVRRREQPSGAGEIGDVRGGLAGVDGIAGQAFQLGALDLGIPIGALHQAHVDRAAEARQPVDHRWRPLAVGLHGQAEAGPVRKCRRLRQLREQFQREFQPLRFLGVDGERHAAAGCLLREFQERGAEFRQHALALQRLEAGMQR